MTLLGLLVTAAICLGAYCIILYLEIKHSRQLRKLEALEELDQMLYDAAKEYHNRPKRHLRIVK